MTARSITAAGAAVAGVLLVLSGTFAPLAARWPFAIEGDGLPSLAPLLDEVTPGVVNISTRGRVRLEQNPLFNDPFFRRFFEDPAFRRFFQLPEDQPVERETQSVGSGVIVDAGRGLVLTNHHVIANADEIVVTLKDRRRLAGRVLGSDPATDIAVLEIPAAGLRAVPFGDSEALRVGDFVIAIGNPFGLGQTVTSGIVSALGRTGLGIEGYEDFIQTDASINPGNSGGALVDLRGGLVGINTAIIGPTGGNIGIGFAIPANMARRVMEQIVAYGEVRRGVLGVTVRDLTPELAEGMRLDVTEGAVVAEVTPGSAAERAGLQPGDVIVALDGAPVRGASALRNKIGILRIGDTVRLSVLRNGREQTLEAEIQAPAEAD
jgi:serine protease Do/serine protease DegQ